MNFPEAKKIVNDINNLFVNSEQYNEYSIKFKYIELCEDEYYIFTLLHNGEESSIIRCNQGVDINPEKLFDLICSHLEKEKML